MENIGIDLFNVINSIPGVKASNISYMNAIGNDNGKTMNIWINTRDHQLLYPIVRCLDKRYANLPWILKVDMSDMSNPVNFHLQSKNVDDISIGDAKLLAMMIQSILDSKSILSYFNLDKKFEEHKKIDIFEHREDVINKIL